MASECAPSSADYVDTYGVGNDRAAKWHFYSLFDLEQWYGSLAEHTFPSSWVALEPAESQAVRRLYRWKWLNSPAVSEEDARCLDALRQKIQRAIDDMGGGEQGCFVRLSSRSPKDVGLSLAWQLRRTERWTELLRELRAGDGRAEPASEEQTAERLNDELRVLMKLCCSELRVTSGDEAVKLLSDSERVFRDLLSAEESATGDHPWNMNVIVRRWVDVNPEQEYRCFVSNQRLVAVSQYNDMLCYPALLRPGAVEQVVRRIAAKFDEVRSLVPHQHYVVDFALDAERAWVVELNPWGPVTGAAFFNWQADRKLLHNTDAAYLAALPPMTISYIGQQVVDGVVARVRSQPGQTLGSYLDMLDSEATTSQLAVQRGLSAHVFKPLAAQLQNSQPSPAAPSRCPCLLC